MKVLIFVFSFFSFHAFSQDKDQNICNEIYGKWQTYYIQLPFGMNAKDKSETWIFNEDGTLIANGKKYTYTLDKDCSKLYIDSEEKYCSITFYEGNLYIAKKIDKK